MDSPNEIRNHPLYPLVRKMLVEERQAPQTVINQMITNSVPVETAQKIVYQIVQENQLEIRGESPQQIEEEEEDRGQVFLLGIFLAMVLPTIAEDSENYFMITLVASVVGAVIGYFYDRRAKILTAICGFLLVFLYPIVQTWYLTGRSSYINYEILLIVAITFIPIAILYFLLRGIFYAKK